MEGLRRLRCRYFVIDGTMQEAFEGTPACETSEQFADSQAKSRASIHSTGNFFVSCVLVWCGVVLCVRVCVCLGAA